MSLFFKLFKETANPTICILHPLTMMHASSLCNSIELPYNNTQHLRKKSSELYTHLCENTMIKTKFTLFEYIILVHSVCARQVTYLLKVLEIKQGAPRLSKL